MKEIFIKKKLKEINFSLDEIKLGDFDIIGELTAKKSRSPDSELYKTAGCFFRPNYERGILIYALIKKFKVSSFLEIGWGRGYSCMCAAMAMEQSGIDGEITTIDPFLNQDHLNELSKRFPSSWFNKVNFINESSLTAIPKLDKKYDLIYIDGDHTYEAVKSDWESSKDKYNKFLLFDDYHKPGKDSGPGIECAKVIDSIDDKSKELIIMDRRIFFDDRRIADKDIDYGQVLLTNKDFDVNSFLKE